MVIEGGTMKFLPLLLLCVLGVGSAAPVALGQTTAELMNEAQRSYLTGDMATAKDKFQMVLELDRNRALSSVFRFATSLDG